MERHSDLRYRRLSEPNTCAGLVFDARGGQNYLVSRCTVLEFSGAIAKHYLFQERLYLETWHWWSCYASTYLQWNFLGGVDFWDISIPIAFVCGGGKCNGRFRRYIEAKIRICPARRLEWPGEIKLTVFPKGKLRCLYAPRKEPARISRCTTTMREIDLKIINCNMPKSAKKKKDKVADFTVSLFLTPRYMILILYSESQA